MRGRVLRSFGWALTAGLAALPASAQAAGSGEPQPGQIGLPESVTTLMDEIVVFHNGVLLWTITAIVLLVLVLLVIVIVRFNARANPRPASFTHNTAVEIAWTVLPIVVLVIIAIPSFGVLTDQLTLPDGERKYLGANIFSWGEVEVPPPELTVKVTGAQWYWTYQYVDQNQSFDSNITPESQLQPGEPRLLTVDNELVIPVDTTVRVQVIAADVMHAFAVPSFGMIIDAVPGRLNEGWFNVRKTGIYYGQCRELCGKDHAYMPIAVRVVTREEFTAWMAALQAGNIDTANETLPPLEAGTPAS